MASKYQPIAQFLGEKEESKLKATFMEIDQLIDGGLPPAAWKHRAWWSNNESHTSSRNGWLAAGWETANVDMEKQELKFVRSITPHMRRNSGTSYEPSMDGRSSLDNAENLLLSEILRAAGGVDNLQQIMLDVRQYINGNIVETELGRLLRKHWPR